LPGDGEKLQREAKGKTGNVEDADEHAGHGADQDQVHHRGSGADDCLQHIAQRHALARELSHGEQRYLEIGIALATDPDFLLLDEPTAGMSRSEADHAVALIRRVTAGKTLVMVEHDMSVVFDLADVVTVLVYGQVIASGPPAEIRASRAVQDAYLGAPAEIA